MKRPSRLRKGAEVRVYRYGFVESVTRTGFALIRLYDGGVSWRSLVDLGKTWDRAQRAKARGRKAVR